MRPTLQKRIFFYLRKDRNGVALVLVLAFVVLLASIIVAFFSRAQAEQQISRSSASQTKVKLLADGAVDTLIGDLKGEIASVASSTNTFDDGSTLYGITNSLTMIPESVGITRTGNLANLVSYSGTKLYSKATDRANGEKTTEAAAGGRSISTARWNKPLLLPDTATSVFDSVKWIPVTRSGGNTSTGSSSALNNASSTTGRYAYVIYDEGGLLDINVAGYPTPVTDQAQANLVSEKGALAFADLQQIGLTLEQINELIDWRNAASKASDKYASAVLASTSGNLRVLSSPLAGSSSDKAFVGRQALIQFLMQKNGAPSSVLQYLTTFSRDLNQPSFAPNPARPKIVGASYSTAYLTGGNDGCRNDDKINPSFLAQRVVTSFKRNDGSTAVAGEPLVKKRFALDRLAWLTYRGPSAERNYSSPGKTGNDGDLWRLENLHGISKEWLALGTKANIRKYFGLEWNNTTGYWEYVDGTIKRLDQITGAEPNFFELLKAAINAGAIARDYSGDRNDESAYSTLNMRVYTSVDRSILQIGANIISQASVDGFPAWIRMNYTGATAPIDVFGVENLPFLYRLRNAVFTTDKTGDGKWVLLQEPEIWNPHGWNPNDTDTSMGYPAPTSFQLNAMSTSAISVRPYAGSQGYVDNPNPVNLNATLTFNNAASLYREPTLLLVPGVPTNGADKSNLTGTENTHDANRALPISGYGRPGLYNNVYPAPLSRGSDPFQYVGFPLSWGICQSGTKKAHQVIPDPNDRTTPFATDIRYQLSCTGPLGNIAYDQKIGRTVTGTNSLSVAYLETDKPAYLADLIPLSANWTVMDPRTARFGFIRDNPGLSGANYNPPPYTSGSRWIYKQQNMMDSARPDGGAGYMADGATDPTNASWYGPPRDSSAGWKTDTSGYRSGLFSQNAKAIRDDGATFSGSGGVPSNNSTYYADADNVVRRAMGGLVTGSASKSATTTTGLPMARAITPNSFTPSTTSSNAIGSIHSRPVILNRPFRSVAELGYVFSDTPWRNLDMSTSESGYTALLDVFCIQDSDNSEGLVAGRVNLNTRQPLVLKAILTGAYMDAYKSPTWGLASALNTASIAEDVANKLVAWTSSTAIALGEGPLVNPGELVGKAGFTTTPAGTNGIDGAAAYTGFSTKLAGVDENFTNIQRMREAPIRALSAVGQTRVWNLMIDLIAQAGHPLNGGAFSVEGERRYWVHVALDRFTGKVVDRQVEIVEE